MNSYNTWIFGGNSIIIVKNMGVFKGAASAGARIMEREGGGYVSNIIGGR